MSTLSFLQNAIQRSQKDELTVNALTNTSTLNSLSIQELSKIAKLQRESQQVSNPNWFQRENKRSIPGHLIKRTALQLNLETTEEEDLDNFASNLSSQTSKKILSSFRKLPPQQELEQYENDLSFDSEGSELPPKKSIYDLNYDDDTWNSGSNFVQRNTTDFINKEPMSFKNAFNANTRGGIITNNVIASSSVNIDNIKPETKFGTLFGNAESNEKTPKPLLFATPNTTQRLPNLPTEYAVLVFGYDDSTFDEILQHFSKFGTILEDFNTTSIADMSSSSPISPFKTQKRVYPIFIGKSWVKITYDNPASAIRACRDNELTINGQLINIIPYSKEVLEKFLNNKISTAEDIGDSLSTLNITKLNKIPGGFEPLLQGTPVMDSTKRTKMVVPNSSIKIKNGSDLFVNVPKKPAPQDPKPGASNGFLKKAGDMLFGFNDI